MSKGMIIIGYQGIGKSSLADKTKNVIDFESSHFWIGTTRVDYWYKIYAKQIVALAKQGYIVCCSSHKPLREELADILKNDPELNNVLSVWTICPDSNLKDEWIYHLEQRYMDDPSTKNKAALDNAIEHFEENIDDISQSPFNHCFIHSINYTLKDIIEHLVELWYVS